MNFAQKHWRRAAQRLFIGVAAMVAWAVCGLALAQSNGDAPGRVARLSDLGGQVWLYTPDATDWVTATRNRPLTTGDRLATDAGGRAELQIGSTTLRLNANTELEVVQLDDGQAALQLHSGSAGVRIRSRDATREFSLTTAEGRFRVDRPGRYRFDRDDNTSTATVYDGAAIYEGRNSALTVNPGQRAEFWVDNAGTAQYSLSDPARDAFASYIGERDSGEGSSVSQRYVSPEMTGADDLDRYGNWEQSPEYGALWIPRGVASDWAPYSTGHWAYVRPWGWTWVDDAPWGFAPFHYGRWVYRRDVWCWAPGTVVARPIYAPALVAWMGAPGINVSVSIGGGGPAVGWFPLAPREVYVPSYHYSPRYVREINVTNVTNVTVINNVINTPPAQRDFTNRRFPHALTVVPTSVVTNRQPVAPAAAQLRGTPWVRNMAEQKPGQAVALATPPVAAPVLPARQLGAPATRPPGFAQRQEGPRDRAEPGRERPAAAVSPGAAPGVAPPLAPFTRPAENNRSVRGAAEEQGAAARGSSTFGRPPLPSERAQPAVRPAPEARSAQPDDRVNPPAIERRQPAPAVIDERRGAGAELPRPPAARMEERRAPLPSPVEQRRQSDERSQPRDERAAPRPFMEERRQIPSRNEAPQAAPALRPAPRQEQAAPPPQAAPAPVARPQMRQEQAAPPPAPRQIEAAPRPAAPPPPAAIRQAEPRQQAPERREVREPRPGAQQQDR